MFLKKIFKYIFFLFHVSSICINLFLTLLYWQPLILHSLVIISWKLNKNKCILTQIEDYLFEETIIDFYFKYIKRNERKYIKFIVPKQHRYLEYFIFFLGIIYHLVFICR